MRRIMIVGHPGAGKSTFASKLGDTLDLPVHHVDQLFSGLPAGQRKLATLRAALAEVMSQPSYILEGGHLETYADRLAGCDTWIWLDPGLRVCVFRVLRRSWLDRRQGQVSPDSTGRMPGGPSLRSMVTKYRGWQRTLVEVTAKAPSDVKIIRLRSDGEVQAFLRPLAK